MTQKYCQSCGVQIDLNAAFCSKCGTSQTQVAKPRNANDKKVGRILIGIFIASIVFVVFFNPSRKEQKNNPSTENDGRFRNQSQSNRYNLTAIEAHAISTLFSDDVRSFVNGEDSVFGNDLVRIKSIVLSKEFEDNEVAALEKYKGKTFLVSANITSIESDLTGDPSLHLNGSGYFNDPIAQFTKEQIVKISKLKKGQKIDLVCNLSTEIIGSVILDECFFLEEYAEKNQNKMTENITKILSVNKKPEKVEGMLLVSSIAIARLFSSNNNCDIQNDDCKKAFTNFLADFQNSKTNIDPKPHIISVQSDLSAKGIDLSMLELK